MGIVEHLRPTMPSTQTPPAKLDPGCPWTYCLQYHALQTMMKDAIVRVDLIKTAVFTT